MATDSRPEKNPSPSLRFRLLFRHGWAMMAIIGFLLAWYLTDKVIFLNYSEPDPITLTIKAEQPLIPTLSIRNEAGNNVAIDFEAAATMPQKIEFFTPQLNGTSCVQHWHPVTLGQQAHPAPDTILSGRAVGGRSAPLAIDIQVGGLGSSTVTCELSTRVLEKSYVHRELAIDNESIMPVVLDGSRLSGADNLALVMPGADQAAGSVTQSGPALPSGYALATDKARVMTRNVQRLLLEWDDAAQMERRDLLLIIIGGIIGLASAALLEWIRPYISE